MFQSVLRYSLLVATLLVLTDAHARQWTDRTGVYHLEASLVGFNDEMVIVQRNDGELGAFPIEALSQADREFLQSKEAEQINTENLGELQTWTMNSGLKMVGRIVDYAKRDVTIQRRRGKIYVNNEVYENVPKIYQLMLPRVVERLESLEKLNQQDFKQWVKDLHGRPQTYTLEGVVLELENGNEYVVPFFLFRPSDRDIVKAGWETWLANQEDYERQSEEAFRLQSRLAAYQRDKEIERQIAIMDLNLQSVQSGLTNAWEVTLYPQPGNPYPPRWVVVLARSSEQAAGTALMQNPGFASGPVRRVSR